MSSRKSSLKWVRISATHWVTRPFGATTRARFTSVYALRPLRFTLKHNPAYFMSLLLNPKKLGRALGNFTRYYLTRPVEWSRGVLNRRD